MTAKKKPAPPVRDPYTEFRPVPKPVTVKKERRR